MSLWRQITHGLRGLMRPAAADQDIADEVDHYLEEAVAALLAQGVAPAEARRQVRLELGTAGSVSEEARSYCWEQTVGVFLSDLLHAARQLRNSPGFTVVIAATLALGIGATTAIFSAVNPILFEPLPYPQAASVVMISDFGPGGAPQETTFGTFLELIERSRSLDAAAVSKPWQPTMIGDAEPERLTGQRVSAGYFRALGVTPMLGRDFQPSDDRLDGPRVAILSDALWRRRLGADGGVIGKEVTLDDKTFEVIGVMPGRFENVLAASAEIWAPLQYSTSLTPDGREWGHHLRMVARLRPDVGLDRARSELDVIARSPLAEFPRVPWASLKQGLVVNSLQHEVTRAVRPALVAVLGAVLFVLAIACVNVTNLLLARGAQRRGEFAMRSALGARPSRLTRQVLTESRGVDQSAAAQRRPRRIRRASRWSTRSQGRERSIAVRGDARLPRHHADFGTARPCARCARRGRRSACRARQRVAREAVAPRSRSARPADSVRTRRRAPLHHRRRDRRRQTDFVDDRNRRCGLCRSTAMALGGQRDDARDSCAW
jgi:hypothetical protein